MEFYNTHKRVQDKSFGIHRRMNTSEERHSRKHKQGQSSSSAKRRATNISWRCFHQERA